MLVLVAIHHPDDYDGSLESEAMMRGIDELNRDMIGAGVRRVALGLRPAREAKSLYAGADGTVSVRDGPYLRGSEHMGGFWILDVASLEEGLEWGKKAVKACRAPVEVRPFFRGTTSG